MPEESDPVSEDEFVLRRVPYTEDNQYFDSSINPPFTRAGFTPHKTRDIDGLSVYRALFTTPEEVALAHRKPGQCYVVRFKVKDLKDLVDTGLSVIPAPRDDGPRGEWH